MKNQRTFTTAILLALCFAGFGARDAQAQWSDNSEVAMLERYMANLVNRDRIKHGKPPIKVNSKLSALARSYAEEMVRTGKFSHVDKKGLDPQQRARLAGIECGIYENLGWQKGSDTPIQMLDAVERSMMNEPENQKNHRYNILHENHYCMGIGVAMKKNQLYAVQEFADDEPAGSQSVFPNQMGGNAPNLMNGNFQPAVAPGDPRFSGRGLVPPPPNGPVLGPSGDPTARDADYGIPSEGDGTQQPGSVRPRPTEGVLTPQSDVIPQSDGDVGQFGGGGNVGAGGFDGNAATGNSGGNAGTTGSAGTTGNAGTGSQSSSVGSTESEAGVLLPENDSEEAFETRRKQFLQKERFRNMQDDEVHNDLED